MKLEYGISKDELLKMKQSASKRRKNKYVDFVVEFLASGKEVAKVNFDKDDKFDTVYSGFVTNIRKNALPASITRMDGSIYIVRKDDKKA